MLAGVTHLRVAAVTAGFEAAFGAAIGAGAAMLVRAAGAMTGERRGIRAAWVLAGLLAGLFTVHLAAGYLANLAFAAPFVGGGDLPGARDVAGHRAWPRSRWAAAVSRIRSSS